MKSLVACVFLLAAVALVVAQDQPQGGRRGGRGGRRGGGAGARAAAPAITSEEDYSKTMKEVQQNTRTLGKPRGAGPVEADARAAATRLEALFKHGQAHWEPKQAEGASMFATHGVA